MNSSGNIIARIIDLDSQAETIRAQAHDEASAMQRETNRQIEQEKRDLEQQITEKTSQVRAKAASEREGELEHVRKEFTEIAESIKNLPEEKIEPPVCSIFPRIKGNTL